MHLIKRTMGLYKPTVSTTDDEFDAVNVPFQVTAKAADDILKAWADNLVWLSMQQANMNLALDGVKNSCGEDQNVPAAALASAMRQRLQTYTDAVRTRQTQQAQATQLISTYAAMCKQAQATIVARGNELKELDYYRGKLESYNKKKSSELDKIAKYEQEVQSRRDKYAKLNAAVVDGMKRILAHRDHVFHDVLVALIDARATHMSVQPDPYSDLARSARASAPHLFSGEPWPELNMGGFSAPTSNPLNRNVTPLATAPPAPNPQEVVPPAYMDAGAMGKGSGYEMHPSDSDAPPAYDQNDSFDALPDGDKGKKS